MALSVNYPDKIIAGLNQSYTVVSDEGPPLVKVMLDAGELQHRLIPLGPPKSAAESTPLSMKYKVTFLLPEGAAGKTLTFELQAGASKTTESKQVVEA